ncbi:helix-turn-helix domain-containing protein [Afifella sp. H1R]|uniref:helix-turn-helix domain-containing protein n=1 Tax=Afifella sp. H1R TaxID=2908841 RepID=UPI001F31D9FA|nr:helix-turn-helix transcriptional regulator [Afifella sp. H1R]MCF1502946.1 helix-turn-helix domain-containing protein [Afifella sp. H1R]
MRYAYHVVMDKHIDVSALRAALGWSRAELALEAGVDVSTVCRWENGGIPRRGPAKALLERLAANVDGASTATAATEPAGSGEGAR